MWDVRNRVDIGPSVINVKKWAYITYNGKLYHFWSDERQNVGMGGGKSVWIHPSGLGAVNQPPANNPKPGAEGVQDPIRQAGVARRNPGLGDFDAKAEHHAQDNGKQVAMPAERFGETL